METIKKTLDLDEHQQTCTTSTPEGPTYTTIMEVPKTKIGMVFWGPNSIGSVYGPSGELTDALRRPPYPRLFPGS